MSIDSVNFSRSSTVLNSFFLNMLSKNIATSFIPEYFELNLIFNGCAKAFTEPDKPTYTESN